MADVLHLVPCPAGPLSWGDSQLGMGGGWRKHTKDLSSCPETWVLWNCFLLCLPSNFILTISFTCGFFNKAFHSVTQAELELITILLPQPARCWGHRHVLHAELYSGVQN